MESVFSMIGAQWTKERNLLTVNTIKSLAQILINFDVDCSEMYQLFPILKDRELLRKFQVGKNINLVNLICYFFLSGKINFFY